MRRHKTLVIFTIVLFTLSLAVPITYAKKDDNSGKKIAKGKRNFIAAQNGLTKGKSPVIHFQLVEMNPDDDYAIIEDGARAKITILTHLDKYVLNGHGLEPYTDYSLINRARSIDWASSPDPEEVWDAEDYEIGTDTSDNNGNVHIMGEWSSLNVGKIWLVPSDDMDAENNNLLKWHPEEFLFNYGLVPAE